MFGVASIIRSFTSLGGAHQYRKHVVKVCKLSQNYRNIHITKHVSGKMFTEHENKYAYDIMETRGYALKLDIPMEKDSNEIIITKHEFNQLLSEDWSLKSPEKIIEAFPIFGQYCSKNDLCISNEIFDSFIDCLTDSLRLATDEQLVSVFYSLLKWPETKSARTRNFIEVWAALDDVCLSRMKDWSYDTLFQFLTSFYILNVSKSSDFCTKAINKMATKAKHLSPGQIVQLLFFIGIQRQSPFDMHNVEVQLERQFTKFNVDDLAIMSMGFFKSKTPIRSMDLINAIIDKVVENSQCIHEVSLAALLKVIRYSKKISVDDKVYTILNVLQNEVERLSIMCNVHIALLGATTLTFHKECLSQIAKKISSTLPESRLKDLERIVLTCGTFNFHPQEGFIAAIMEELRKPEREIEITKHGRSFALCVSYANLLHIHPLDLMGKALSSEFLEHTYGKYTYYYGREILSIHNTIEIFFKDAQTNKLPDKVVTILAKKYTDYVPQEDYTKKQYNVTEKMFLDVFKIVEINRGKDFVLADHILPHHQRGDIILCNHNDGSPAPVEAFDKSKFGLIRKPPDSNMWIVLIIAGRNAIIRDTDTPTGPFQIKVEELKMLGYYPALVTHTTFSRLSSTADKTDYLNKLIKDAIKLES